VYLIVGLGNPGSRYRDTRHNVGFWVIDLWSQDLGVRLAGRRYQSRNVRTRFQDQDIILLCPQTFMNLSGKSVKGCSDYYHLESRKILVIHDDLDLPVGGIKVVREGGAGGHRGVLSVIEHLGSMQFPRIKIGIGRPRYGETIEDYVLSPFYQDEKNMMEKAVKMAVRACELFVSEGIETTMNHVNCMKFGY
jgi:PTH1 family peptidyl-tRNA hydrolase